VIGAIVENHRGVQEQSRYAELERLLLDAFTARDLDSPVGDKRRIAERSVDDRDRRLRDDVVDHLWVLGVVFAMITLVSINLR
jgi:hypothetical protein